MGTRGGKSFWRVSQTIYFLCGMNGFFQNILPKLFVQGVGSRQVHCATQDIAQLPAQPHELKQPHMGIGFVFHQDVDIAVFFTLPAGNRPKDIKASDRESAHNTPIFSQQRNDLFSFHIKNLAQPPIAFKFWLPISACSDNGASTNFIRPSPEEKISRKVCVNGSMTLFWTALFRCFRLSFGR